MSVYGKQTQHEIIERPFTAILNTDPIKFTRNNELREIDAIKKRFNKYEVNGDSLRSTFPCARSSRP